MSTLQERVASTMRWRQRAHVDELPTVTVTVEPGEADGERFFSASGLARVATSAGGWLVEWKNGEERGKAVVAVSDVKAEGFGDEDAILGHTPRATVEVHVPTNVAAAIKAGAKWRIDQTLCSYKVTIVETISEESR